MLKTLFVFWLIILSFFNVSAQTKKAEILHPEFFEMANIAYALTEFSQTDANMTDKSSDYYSRVVKYFEPHKNHPLIAFLNEEVKKDYGRYIANRSYAVNFEFENGRIVERDIVSPLTKIQAGFLGNHFKDSALWEDFAKQSDFRKFYSQNKAFYEKTLQTAEKNLPLDKIQTWFEREFPERYDRYKIYISPLIGGTHSTNRARFQNLNQCFMFVSDANGYDAKKFTPKQIEGLYTGVVFTEIDHNYNNPVSAKLNKEIESAMPDQAKWSNGAEAEAGFYKSALKIFDEYATHSVYLLYIHDNFSAKDYEFIRDRKVNQMINRRGFAKFKEFHEAFLQIYKSKKQGEKLADLYPQIVDWLARQETKKL